MTCSDQCGRYHDRDDINASLLSWQLGVDLIPIREVAEISISRTSDDELLLRCRHSDPAGALLDLAVRGLAARVQDFVDTGRIGIALRRLQPVIRADDGSLIVADEDGQVTRLFAEDADLPIWPTPEALADIPVPARDGEDRLFRVAVGLPQETAAAGDFAVRWVVDPKVTDGVGPGDSSDRWITGTRHTMLKVLNGGRITAAGVTVGGTKTDVNSSDFRVRSKVAADWVSYAGWADSPVYVDGRRRA